MKKFYSKCAGKYSVLKENTSVFRLLIHPLAFWSARAALLLWFICTYYRWPLRLYINAVFIYFVTLETFIIMSMTINRKMTGYFVCSSNEMGVVQGIALDGQVLNDQCGILNCCVIKFSFVDPIKNSLLTLKHSLYTA